MSQIIDPAVLPAKYETVKSCSPVRPATNYTAPKTCDKTVLPLSEHVKITCFEQFFVIKARKQRIVIAVLPENLFSRHFVMTVGMMLALMVGTCGRNFDFASDSNVQTIFRLIFSGTKHMLYSSKCILIHCNLGFSLRNVPKAG